MSLDWYWPSQKERNGVMVLSNRLIGCFWFVVTCCPAGSCLYANLITIHNHARYPVYAAVYYVGVNWLDQTVGPVTRQGGQIV